MHKSAVGRVLNQIQRRVRKACLRENKARIVDGLSTRHASSTGEGTTSNVERLCGSGPEYDELEKVTGGGSVEGGGEHGIAGMLGKISTPYAKTDYEVDPSSPGDETVATIVEAREILARLQEAAET